MGLKAQCVALHLSLQSWDRTGMSAQARLRPLLTPLTPARTVLPCRCALAGTPLLHSFEIYLSMSLAPSHRREPVPAAL